MSRFFDFLYCCFYRWSQKTNGDKYPHAYSASVMMSFNLMVILGGIASIVIAASGVDIDAFPSWRIVAVITAIAILFLVHRHFSSDGRYLEVIRSFDSSRSTFRKRPGVVVALSFCASLLFLFSIWFVLLELNGAHF